MNSWQLVKSVVNQGPPTNYDFPGGSTTQGTQGQPPIPTLFNLINRWYYDPDRQVVGLLESYYTGSGGNRKQKYRLRTEDGRRIPIVKGYRLLDPQAAQLYTVGDRYDTGGGSRDFIMTRDAVSEAQWDRFFPPGSEFGGSAARDYAGEAAQQHAYDVELERIRQAFDAQQREADRASAMELQRLQEENALKRAKLGEAGSLARTAAEVQQQARQFLTSLQGVDPVRQSVGAQGGVLRGTTPAQAHMQNLTSLANAPLPQVSENAQIPEIDQTIQNLQNYQNLPVTPILGMAYGGTINATEPTAQIGSTKRAILVGEKGGFTGDEEVVVVDSANPGRTEVIPLMAGAASGGSFGLPQTALTYQQPDISSIKSALAPIFAGQGFQGDVPSLTRGPFGYHWGVGGSDMMRRLGYEPRLIRDWSSGATYFRNPAGVLGRIPDMDAFNQWFGGKAGEEVFNVAPEEISSWGPIMAGALGGPPPQIEQPVQNWPRRSIPLATTPLAGNIPLPDIRFLAPIWRYLDPGSRTTLVSAYGVGGLGAPESALTAIEEAVRAFTPVGTQRRGQTARFS